MTDEVDAESDCAERSEVFGPIDSAALRRIRELVVDAEPLVDSASLDDPVNPQTLVVELADGIGEASAARFDVRWSLAGNNSFHYTDDGERDFRFDCHPKPDAPTRHFHSPPDAEPVERSCITVTEVRLVTRAVLQRWRHAYEIDSFEGINQAENPP